ncbi:MULTISPECIES: ATP-binding protein [unclassified Pseudoxanthomonas]|uniref:ATP-binding protein n=1 Tax=unclassified Pseudoxanthomonas TaxID=2645906 RepID=UPI003077868F
MSAYIHPKNQGVIVTTGTVTSETQITGEGIKKHFKSTEPVEAVYELVWNGFDAGASEVRVRLERNQLGGLSRVIVWDNGEGIQFEITGSNFGLFNDSAKKLDVAQHGSHGRGRLAFHRLALQADWYTRHAGKEAVISIEDHDIKKFSVIPGEVSQYVSEESGTTVVLSKTHKELPDRLELLECFSQTFGWYLALHPAKRLLVDDELVAIPKHELHGEVIEIGSDSFRVDVIRWIEKPNDEKSYVYLIDSAGRTVHRRLSSLNNKKNFYTSVYVASSWADSFAATSDLINPSTNTLGSRAWSELERGVSEITRKLYEEFLRKEAEKKVAQYEEEGFFPTYSGLAKPEAEWRLQNTKELVKNIYIADPALFSLNKKQAKVLIRLLDKLAVSDENDSLWEILNSVLELDQATSNKLAAQLQQTTLENIVNTIEVLQKRINTIHEIRYLMDEHHAEVTETPDLQKIIENNTWLFGPQYELLGAEEATFTKISKNLRGSIKGIDDIEEKDVEGLATVEGANRQPDLFLARKVVSFDSFGKQVYRCVIVEIKRPGVSLNVKHLRQLDDYAAIIKKYPAFSSEFMRFELILVGRKISDADTEIVDRLRDKASSGEIGLYLSDGKTKRYVLNWYTLLDGHELANQALIDSLRLRRDDLTASSKQRLVERLQGIDPVPAMAVPGGIQ